MPNKNQEDIIARLSDDISDIVGTPHDDELTVVSDIFTKSLNDALGKFNSSSFDNDGFIKRLKSIDLDPEQKDVMNNVLNTLQHDYLSVESLNQSELLLRRDLDNICAQMPAMSDAVSMIRDGIVECNVATGEISRSFSFEGIEHTDEKWDPIVIDVEKKKDLQRSIKNFIIPNTLRGGEYYAQIRPYSKLFAELEVIHNVMTSKKRRAKQYTTESADTDKSDLSYIPGYKCLADMDDVENAIKVLTESMSTTTKTEVDEVPKIDNPSLRQRASTTDTSDPGIHTLLQNIDVYKSSSILFAEYGLGGLVEVMEAELQRKAEENSEENSEGDEKQKSFDSFMEDFRGRSGPSIYNSIDPDAIDISKYKDIKGCYIKYLDPLRVVPVRIDRKIVGYYYISTTMDLQTNPAQPNGIIDLSFQSYTRDRNIVGNLANIIIQSFDDNMLKKNVDLKEEIVEVIMAHKFSEGRLSFIFIPENEICRFAVNEDENGKGHSIIEPSIFPARMYLMNNLYNMLYMLNNTMTRVHYVKSSGIDKNYSAQVQRAMRKLQSRRITIDDIFSYAGVLNKIGGMGEMVLPAGRGDQKAFETDTIEPVANPINVEYLEQQRREAVSGTRAPITGVLNSIDEVDFAKSLELSNTRTLSTVSTYKIDFNRDLTHMYQMILRYETDMDENVLRAFRFQFNQAKQQELNITGDMIQNFDAQATLIESLYYTKQELEDENGNATPLRRRLRKELARIYLAQLDIDMLDEIVDRVKTAANQDTVNQNAATATIKGNDLGDITEQ